MAHYILSFKRLKCIILLAYCGLFFLTCGKGQFKNGDIKSIQLTVNLPIVTLNNNTLSFFNLTDLVYITYYKNDILYKLAPSRIFETNQQIPGTESYFIYKKGNHFGYWFTSLDSLYSWRKMQVDSFLKERAFASSNFQVDKNASLVYSMKDNHGNFLLKKYIPKKKNDELTFDSVYVYFTNDLRNIDYSFSPISDSLENMKLFKIRLLYNESFSTKYNKTLPKREYSFEIRKITPDNIEKLRTIFKEFKNIPNNKLR